MSTFENNFEEDDHILRTTNYIINMSKHTLEFVSNDNSIKNEISIMLKNVKLGLYFMNREDAVDKQILQIFNNFSSINLLPTEETNSVSGNFRGYESRFTHVIDKVLKEAYSNSIDRFPYYIAQKEKINNNKNLLQYFRFHNNNYVEYVFILNEIKNLYYKNINVIKNIYIKNKIVLTLTNLYEIILIKEELLLKIDEFCLTIDEIDDVDKYINMLVKLQNIKHNTEELIKLYEEKQTKKNVLVNKTNDYLCRIDDYNSILKCFCISKLIVK